MLTGEEAYLQPYTDARAQLQTKLDTLQGFASSGDLPKPQIDKITELTQAKLSEMEQTISLRRAQGLDPALAIVRSSHGKQIMDDIRTAVGQMRAHEEREFAGATRGAGHARIIHTVAFIGVGILNLVFLAWAFGKISGEMSRRESADLETNRQKQLLATTLASIGDVHHSGRARWLGRFASGQPQHCTYPKFPGFIETY